MYICTETNRFSKSSLVPCIQSGVRLQHLWLVSSKGKKKSINDYNILRV